MACGRVRLHDRRPQEREHQCIGSVCVAVGVLTELGVAAGLARTGSGTQLCLTSNEP
jgi:hypothetical protein